MVQLVEHQGWHVAGEGSIPSAVRHFFARVEFQTEQALFQCLYSPLCAVACVTFVRLLKILAAGRHTIVWIHGSAACTSSTLELVELEDRMLLPK